MSWVRIVLLLIFKNIFFFQRNLHFREHFLVEISPECDVKAENSCSYLYKFYKGRKGLRPMGSIMLTRFKCLRQEPFLTVLPRNLLDSS